MAWHAPPLPLDGQGDTAAPHNSNVLQRQKRLLKATRGVLAAIAKDVRAGLLETVGINSELAEGARASVVIELPPGTDIELIARAINSENVEAWRDEQGRV
ncbi:MAG: hypothetical protein H0V88_06980, partial [Pyrinomonadaceae bacterium]|nr:hypothetical protein [Pyrinomonadaceae bacterium]